MKYEKPIITVYKLKTEEFAAGDVYNTSGKDDDDVNI